jgi:predicted nucleic acid-binding protein
LIVDTDALIWELRGNSNARDVIHTHLPFKISTVSYMELVRGSRNKKEMTTIISQLSRWNVEILQISSEISTRAMIYIEEYCLSHSMELADALIAATCISNSEILLTANEKHYRHIPNIQIKKFVP